MALSGSDLAYRQARAGVARAGASRAGYFTYNVVVTIGGTDQTAAVMRRDENDLRVRLRRGDEASTAEFTVERDSGFAPTAGQVVTVALGSSSNPIFGGQIDSVTHVRFAASQAPRYRVSCIDWRRLFNRRTITADFSGQSGTDIGRAIVAYCDGFTDYGIKTGMATVDEFICINEEPSAALVKLATLLGGGCIPGDARKIVHLWDSGGPSSSHAPTNPDTLTNTLASLETFRPEYDFSQVRTRVIVEGKSTKALVALPAGEDTYTYGVPVEYGWMLSVIGAAGQCRIGTDVVWFSDRTGKTGIEARPEAEVTSTAAVGATSIAVDSNVDFPLYSWYLDSNGNYFRAHNPFITGGVPGPTTSVDSIPSSGYGSILQEIPAGTKLYAIDTLHGVTRDALGTLHGLLSDYEDGTSVVVHVEVDDTAAQAAIAAIEGGDGIHEHVVTDSELSYAGATNRAMAELSTFGDTLLRATWRTRDMNGVPGASIALNLSSPDVVTGTLTIDTVTLEFPPKLHALPWRTCEGSTVKLETILDAIRG